MNKNGYAPNMVSRTALMEAYGKGGRYNNAEAIFLINKLNKQNRKIIL